MHQKGINPKGSLNKSEEINQIAITVWEEVHNSFKSNNINQNLAIYNLIPHQERISILRRLNAKSDKGTIDEIFRANQKLKYYDLFKASSAQEEISIRALQDKLSPKQVFIDISFNHPNDELILIIISRNDANLSVVSNSIKPIIKTLNESILEVNYSLFVEASKQLYDKFFGTINHDFEEVVICPDGMTNDIPFEALLVSETNINTKDYRKLDYLISHKSVRYVMTPQSFSNEIVKANWSFSIFTPTFNNSEFAKLPFSQKLGANLNAKLKINWYDGENATISSFLNNKDEVVHLSTHSNVDEDVTSNHVMLSDNAFYQTEFENLSKTPLLMVLNSCNSGKGNHLPGDGIDGIVRELHRLGISSMIANQWEVDDKVSNEIFELFYLKLSEGFSSNEAMRKAKLAHIKNAPSSELGAPYYWAGHKVVGESIQVNKAKDRKWFLIIVFCCLGILFSTLLITFLKKA